MTTDATNPLLDFSGLPRFDAILAEHVTPAIDHLLARSRTVVQQLEAPQGDVTWDSFVTPLENATELLGRAWSIVNHLNSVVDTPELRATYNDNQPKVTEFWTELSQNEALFAKYKALRASDSFASLSPARQRIIDNAIRDFRMGGAELPADKKERFAAIQEEHAAVSTRFSENVLDATNDYKLLVTEEAELAGLALAERVRDELPNLRLQVNAGAGSFKSQFKKADKSGALYALILGDDEMAQQVVGFKPLRGQGEQQSIAWDALAAHLATCVVQG